MNSTHAILELVEVFGILKFENLKLNDDNKIQKKFNFIMFINIQINKFNSQHNKTLIKSIYS